MFCGSQAYAAMLLFDPWMLFSMNVSCENMAYSSLGSEKCPATGVSSMLSFLMADLCGRHVQVGSLAGAAHVLNDNVALQYEWKL